MTISTWGRSSKLTIDSYNRLPSSTTRTERLPIHSVNSSSCCQTESESALPAWSKAWCQVTTIGVVDIVLLYTPTRGMSRLFYENMATLPGIPYGYLIPVATPTDLEQTKATLVKQSHAAASNGCWGSGISFLPVLESLFGLWFVEYHDVESLALGLVIFCHRVGSQLVDPILFTPIQSVWSKRNGL